MPIWSALSCECLIYDVGHVLIWCLYCWSGMNLVWHAREHLGSTELAQASGLVAQNESSCLSENLSPERDGLAWARPRRAHYCNLAQTRSGSLNEGFLSPEWELLRLSEIDSVDRTRVCFLMIAWCVALQSHVWGLVCIILYDTMGLEFMSLVWENVWIMVCWLVEYFWMTVTVDTDILHCMVFI